MMTFPLPGANWTSLHTLRLVATTGAAGFALVNGTGPVLTWTAPDDGQLHRVMVFGSIFVSSDETGGLVQLKWQGPGASAFQFSQIFAAGLAASTSSQLPTTAATFTVAPGTTVTLQQSTALTAGAATMYAEIWAY